MSGPYGESSGDRVADLAANANGRQVAADVERVGSGFDVHLERSVVACERRFDRAVEQMVGAARRALPHPPHQAWGALVNCLCGAERFAFSYGNMRQPGGKAGLRLGLCVQQAIDRYPLEEAGIHRALEHAERSLVRCCRCGERG
jgi:hypothetical protein